MPTRSRGNRLLLRLRPCAAKRLASEEPPLRTHLIWALPCLDDEPLQVSSRHLAGLYISVVYWLGAAMPKIVVEQRERWPRTGTFQTTLRFP